MCGGPWTYTQLAQLAQSKPGPGWTQYVFIAVWSFVLFLFTIISYVSLLLSSLLL